MIANTAMNAKAIDLVWGIVVSQVALMVGPVGWGGDLPRMNNVRQEPSDVQRCTGLRLAECPRLAGRPGIADVCAMFLPSYWSSFAVLECGD